MEWGSGANDSTVQLNNANSGFRSSITSGSVSSPLRLNESMQGSERLSEDDGIKDAYMAAPQGVKLECFLT